MNNFLSIGIAYNPTLEHITDIFCRREIIRIHNFFLTPNIYFEPITTLKEFDLYEAYIISQTSDPDLAHLCLSSGRYIFWTAGNLIRGPTLQAGSDIPEFVQP